MAVRPMEPLEVGDEEEDGLLRPGSVRDGPITIRVTVSKQARHRRLNSIELASLGTYWFGWSFLWLPLLVVMIPMQVSSMASEDSKGAALSHTLLLGSGVSLFAAPVFGSLSDSSRNAMGRRRPFMIVGTLIATFALLWMALAKDLYWYSLGFLVLSFANNMIMSPYSAMVPDIVPPSQRGLASGWLGLMSMLGNLMGGLLSYYSGTLGWPVTYSVLALVHGVCMFVTVRVIKEVPIREVVSPFKLKDRIVSFIRPLQAHDFRLVFFTRFLMQMGILSVQEYLQFYVQDALQRPYAIMGFIVAENPSEAVSVLFVPMLLGAIASSLLAGAVSDRLGGQRKSIVYLSGGMMALSSLLFSLTRSYSLDMFLGLLFGLGFGAFSVMDWAMATDVLPNADEFAKDMGIWSLALVLPQVIAAPISGWLLDYFQSVGKEVNLGYSVVFLVAVLYYALGTFFVKFIDGVH